MIEQLVCRACFAKLNRVNLERLKKVVITCPECGTVNDYIYDPEKYVKKAPDPARQRRLDEGGQPPLDTLKSSKRPT